MMVHEAWRRRVIRGLPGFSLVPADESVGVIVLRLWTNQRLQSTRADKVCPVAWRRIAKRPGTDPIKAAALARKGLPRAILRHPRGLETRLQDFQLSSY